MTQPSVGQHDPRVNRLSVDTIGRYVGRHSADTSANMLRSRLPSVLVECQWCIGRLLVVSEFCTLFFFRWNSSRIIPTGYVKEESSTYARVLIERGCSLNCRHFEYVSNATWGFHKHWVGKKGLTRTHQKKTFQKSLCLSNQLRAQTTFLTVLIWNSPTRIPQGWLFYIMSGFQQFWSEL